MVCFRNKRSECCAQLHANVWIICCRNNIASCRRLDARGEFGVLPASLTFAANAYNAPVARRFQNIHHVHEEHIYTCPHIVEIARGFQIGQQPPILKAACNFNDVWAFIDVFFVNMIDTLESSRHWGMVCICCKSLRDAGKTPNCPHASRRLHEARLFLQQLIQTLACKGRNIRFTDCESIP